MNKRSLHPGVILLALILILTISTWFLPSLDYKIITDPLTGNRIIDQSTVKIVAAKGVLPWELPGIIFNSISSVLPTIILLCCANGAFSILIATGMFDVIIAFLCKKFEGRESSLILMLMTGFSALGLVVPPHCFIGFVSTVIFLTIRLGYDALVGLGIVLFGATISAMSGPLSAVTVLCQQAVGLPIYSGIGVRLLSYVIFLIVTNFYLQKYAKKIKNDSKMGYLYGKDINREESMITEDVKLKKIYFIVIALLIMTFGVIVCGSTFYSWGMNDISMAFCIFGLVSGILLKFNLSEIMRHFIDGVRGMSSTSVIISLASAVTSLLKVSGLFNSSIYYASAILTKLPNFLVPIGILFVVGIMNVILPSGPAKGVMLMPLIGPIGQLSNMTMQSSVLAYNFGDSFSNYLLPYDSTTATYLDTAKIPYNIWVKFIFKLFLIWNLVGSLILVAVYYIGYGPF